MPHACVYSALTWMVFLINMVTCNHIKWRRLPTKKLFLLLLKISFHNRCLLDDTVLYLKAVVV